MKKIVSGMAVLAGVAAVAAYVLKKNEQKKIMELDEGLLYDEPTAAPASADSAPQDEEEGEEEETPLQKTDPNYPNLTVETVEHISTEHQRLVEELKAEGDDNEADRPIQHLVHFNNEVDAENFRKTVVNKGFVVSKGEGDFDLIVLHISPIDQIRLVTNELYLADQAYANHGEYKGWHARVANA